MYKYGNRAYLTWSAFFVEVTTNSPIEAGSCGCNKLTQLLSFHNDLTTNCQTYYAIVRIVIPWKRIKSTELLPSVAQLFRGVTIEAANVRSHQWYTVQTEAEEIFKEKITLHHKNLCLLLTYGECSVSDRPKWKTRLRSSVRRNVHVRWKWLLKSPQVVYREFLTRHCNLCMIKPKSNYWKKPYKFVIMASVIPNRLCTL